MCDEEHVVSSTTDPEGCFAETSQYCPSVRNVDDLAEDSIHSEIPGASDSAAGTSSSFEDVTNSSAGPALTNPTLQGLLTSPVSLTPTGSMLSQDGVQIIAMSGANELLSTDSSSRGWQVVHPDLAIIISPDQIESVKNEFKQDYITNQSAVHAKEEVPENELSDIAGPSARAFMPPPPPPLPPNCPVWAQRMMYCEAIGNSYRGYVENEVELDLLLTYHKQQTQSFWGTRQSPSPAKPSTRLMWKSQYVPFDGIPFVNSGSRAVVMECQFGPRRKGSHSKLIGENVKQSQKSDNYYIIPGDYKQTCPARIYIKKVRKFPEFAIDPKLEKKALKLAMFKAFLALKQHGLQGIGQDRYYLQLPTEAAHEYHAINTCAPSISPSLTFDPPSTSPSVVDTEDSKRLDSRVAKKLRDLVASGESRLYSIRRKLRNFVIRDLYQGIASSVPKKHDLTLFPTINDLKNHIHKALRDIEAGTLPLNPTPLESMESEDSGEDQLHQAMWDQDEEAIEAVPETVTVTLTQNPGEDGHVVSRIETHLSDGTTRVSSTLTPETAQLLARLHPNMFPANFLLQQPADQGVTAISDPSVPPSNHVKVEEDSDIVNHMTQSVAPSDGDNLPVLSSVTVSSMGLSPLGNMNVLSSAGVSSLASAMGSVPSAVLAAGGIPSLPLVAGASTINLSSCDIDMVAPGPGHSGVAAEVLSSVSPTITSQLAHLGVLSASSASLPTLAGTASIPAISFDPSTPLRLVSVSVNSETGELVLQENSS